MPIIVPDSIHGIEGATGLLLSQFEGLSSNFRRSKQRARETSLPKSRLPRPGMSTTNVRCDDPENFRPVSLKGMVLLSSILPCPFSWVNVYRLAVSLVCFSLNADAGSCEGLQGRVHPRVLRLQKGELTSSEILLGAAGPATPVLVSAVIQDLWSFFS